MVSDGNSFAYLIFAVIWLAVVVLFLAANWKIFTKAGQPGWASLIPFYNLFVMMRIVGLPAWFLLLYFVPIANLFVSIYVVYRLATAFGKGVGYTVGLIFLSPIFFPLLAFGDAEYQGAEGGGEGMGLSRF